MQVGLEIAPRWLRQANSLDIDSSDLQRHHILLGYECVVKDSNVPRVVIYTKDYCPFCSHAKTLLRSKNVDFEEIDVTHDGRLQEEVQRLSGRRSVPQIFINGKSVGGFDDLRRLDASGELDQLLGRHT